MDIVKLSGEKEPFDPDKLCESIKSAGAPDDLATNVCGLVQQKITPDVTSTQIFRRALGYLMKEDLVLGVHYSLRRAVAGLGPAGFIFEQYIEAILQAHGYETERGKVMRGHCVEHEIDVFATKANMHCLVEAKFRNEPGTKTHINDVMYADARLIDIMRHHQGQGETEDHQMWVMTNTKFTKKAITYGRCRRMKLIGWNYPGKQSLEQMIITKKMYPITVLPSVSEFEREKFVKKNMVLVRDILPYSAEDLIHDFNFPPEIAQKITAEAHELVA